MVMSSSSVRYDIEISRAGRTDKVWIKLFSGLSYPIRIRISGGLHEDTENKVIASVFEEKTIVMQMNTRVCIRIPVD